MPGGQETFSDEQLRRACGLMVKGYVWFGLVFYRPFQEKAASSILRFITHTLSNSYLGTGQVFPCPRHEGI